MEPRTINPSTMSVIELKAAVYDLAGQQEAIQSQINALNQFIIQKSEKDATLPLGQKSDIQPKVEESNGG